jgi:hypothetical protein
LSVAVPSITTSKTALDFSFVEQNFSSAPLNYQITALNLASDVTVASGNFTISKAATTGFGTNLVLQLLTLIMETNNQCEICAQYNWLFRSKNHEATNATTKSKS